MRYWDTSAILKLYVAEPDSPYFLGLITRAGGPIFSSAIASTEVLCALFRKERAGDLKPGGASALMRRFQADCAAGRIQLIPYGADVTAEAERLGSFAFAQTPPLLIRSLDLIHIASASVARATILVTTDERLRAMGSRLNLQLSP